jgi:hypothetical protein
LSADRTARPPEIIFRSRDDIEHAQEIAPPVRRDIITFDSDLRVIKDRPTADK